MTTFNDREKGFENKFAHDEEMQFKAAARRNKLARSLGRQRCSARPAPTPTPTRWRSSAPTSSRPATRTSSASSPADLDYRADEPTIRAKMAELLAVAKSQIMDELPGS